MLPRQLVNARSLEGGIVVVIERVDANHMRAGLLAGKPVRRMEADEAGSACVRLRLKQR